MGRTPSGPRLDIIMESKNYKNGEFKNNSRTTVMQPGSFWTTLVDWCKGDQVRVPKSPPPIVKLNKYYFSQQPESGLRVTWLGHNTVIIEIDGYIILTDPVFSRRVSPVMGIGPKRFHEAPIKISELPDIDAVVISHDHYDHLDYQSIKELAPKTAKFYLPMGVGAHLESWGVKSEKIVELDWWEESRFNDDLLFAAVPARHFSGRGVLDRNKTQWSMWAIVGDGHRVFFGGDTGMCRAFLQAGDKYGPFDVTLIPIGAYGPNWPHIHLTPEEGVQAHLDVRGDLMIPVHWGTFNLAFHGWTEPVERLLVSAEQKDVRIAAPKPGEAVLPSQPVRIVRWWPDVYWERAETLPVKETAELAVLQE